VAAKYTADPYEIKNFCAWPHILNLYQLTIHLDLRQVGGFLRFPPPIKLSATI